LLGQHTRRRYAYLGSLKQRGKDDTDRARAATLEAYSPGMYQHKDLDKFVFNTEAHPLWLGEGCTGACSSPFATVAVV
jgi:hypothetical protein